ncbi:unnamed protein product [Symbiodinium natans]|uniref:Uncharacterized protein n=1 Tax=Symbiodinium natans TaxID=878477 RepID=A0A812H123_9DINO|nr:unnamed protein product [Symbiodinium natans]
MLSWRWSLLLAGEVVAVQPPTVPPYAFRCQSAFYSTAVPVESPKTWSCEGARVHPISFAIPAEDVVPCVPEKFTDFASLRPGVKDTYIFPMTSFGEMEYKRMYREARFAVKVRRKGWETMRIYEILASGSLPYIENVDQIPPTALVFVNKTLLKAAHTLGARKDGVWPGYATLAAELLRHTQQHLTTEALARYILSASRRSTASKVLYISHCLHGDYQCYVSLHGLRKVLGSGLVDIPRLDYMYEPRVAAMRQIKRTMLCPQTSCTVVSGGRGETGKATFDMAGEGMPVALYGGGFSYAYRLPELPINRSLSALRRSLAAHEFDAVIFPNTEVAEGQGPREVRQLVQLVQRHYDPKEIIVLDGRDPDPDGRLHAGVAELAAQGFVYFLREPPSFCKAA